MDELPQKPVLDKSRTFLARQLCASGESAPELTAAESERVPELAVKNGVAPLLSRALQGPERPVGLTGEDIRTIADAALADAARHLRQSVELAAVLAAFASEGVRYVLMKGTALAHRHYPEPWLRPRTDTDILFADAAEADRAWAILQKMGYSRSITTTGDFVGYQFCCFRHLGAGVVSNLDCHIRINDYPLFAHRFEFAELDAQAVPIPALGAGVRALGDVHALVLACLHRTAALANHEFDRLIWLYDVHLLAESFSSADWEHFRDMVINKQLAATCLRTLDDTLRYFPVALPGDILKTLRTAAAGESFQPGEETRRLNLYWASLKSLPNGRARLRMIREHLFPPPSYMRQKYPGRSMLLLPWWYVHRVLSGIGRYI